MTKILSFASLATATATLYASLEAAVEAGAAATSASAQSVRTMPKADRREYLKQATSNWPCLSLTEAVSPLARVSGENPPQLLHGFAADYDAVGKRWTNAELADAAKRMAYPPAAGGPSLSGDGVHAIWLFAEPIPVLGSMEYAKKVMAVVYKNLRAGNFMQGFDEAFRTPDRLLSIDPANFGWLTELKEAQVVDATTTRMWAASVTKSFKFEGPALDLKKVYEKVQAMFPNRWTGPFDCGSRGPRFWDTTASDPTAAIVTDAGMVYFSDGGGFKPWSSILGHDSVSKLSAESLGELTANWFYDSTQREYILHDPAAGSYSPKNRTQLFDRLELAGLENDVDRKRALVYIEDHQKVTGLVQLANQRRGVIHQGAQRYINATDTLHIVPSAGEHDFISGLLDCMFGKEQLDYFLGWLKDSFQCILEQEPSYSQAIFMAGNIESGKSLLQYRILTPMFGGKYADPMGALLGESGFNSELAAAGHWLVSDAEGAKNNAQRSSFTQKIKAIAANPGWSVHAKYKEPVTLYLNSRISFTFNRNDDCLSVIPRLGSDILDKIIMLSVHDHEFLKGLDKRRIEATIAEQLPGFCYWLVNDYEVPPHVRSTGRYRTKSYHSPELLNYAKACQDSSELLGWLNVLFTQEEHMRKDYFDAGKVAEYTAAVWLKMISQVCGNHFSMTGNKMSAYFRSLAKQYPEAIKERLDTKQKVYTFSVDYKKLTEK